MTRHIKENEQEKEAEVVRLRTPPRKIWIDLMTGTICAFEQAPHCKKLTFEAYIEDSGERSDLSTPYDEAALRLPIQIDNFVASYVIKTNRLLSHGLN